MKHKPNLFVFQRVESHSLSSGNFSRGHAIMSLSLILPVVLSSRPELSDLVLNSMVQCLPVRETELTELHYWTGLAFGSLLGTLLSSGVEDDARLMPQIKKLESISFSGSLGK